MFFNGIELDDYFKILDIRRPILPIVSPNTTNIENGDGSKDSRKSILEEGTIEVDIKLSSDSLVNKRKAIRNLASMLFSRDVKELKFKDELDKHYLAKISGNTDLSEVFLYGRATLSFVAPDPIAFGEKKVVSISTNANIKVNGTYETKPKFIFNITSGKTYIQVVNTDSGELVKINHNFIAGNTLTIDFNKKWKTNKNNVVIDEDVTFESDFFHLSPGSNNIVVSSPATLEYVERWL